MNASKCIVIILAFVWASCSYQKPPNASVTQPTPPCCMPTFDISFWPESPVKGIDNIEISEDKGVPSIMIDDRKGTRLSRAEYESLKRAILRSPLWRGNAKTPYQSMTFSGPPRDILTITHEEYGLSLQGSDVPPRWKQRILNLARSAGHKG